MDDSNTDEALMRRYSDGDVEAFAVLYKKHKAPLYRYCRRLAQPEAVAEELFQDIWMSVIRSRERYEARAKFSTWLYRMAHNRLVDYYRRHASGVPLSDDEAAIEAFADAPIHEPENELDRRRWAQRLQEALVALPPAQREAFLLREEGGLSLEEIAEITGVNAETAKSRLRYGTAKLREALAAYRIERDPKDAHG
jgi:RNA polymerase sigma-70 factor, ECF subfamily